MSNISSWDLTHGGVDLPSIHRASPVSLCLKSGALGFLCKVTRNVCVCEDTVHEKFITITQNEMEEICKQNLIHPSVVVNWVRHGY